MNGKQNTKKDGLVPIDNRAMIRSTELVKRGLVLADDLYSKITTIHQVGEIRRFEGHIGSVNSAVFSPDGRYALSGSSDKTIRLWDIASGREIRRFTGHTDIVNSVIFSPDGRYVLSSSDDKTIRLWDAESAKEIQAFMGHTDRVRNANFSFDTQRVLSSGWDDTIRIWDIKKGRQIKYINVGIDLWDIAFPLDNQRAFCRDLDGSIHIWNLETAEKIDAFETTEWGDCIAVSPNNRYLLLSGIDDTAHIWDLESRCEIRRFGWGMRRTDNACEIPENSDLFDEFDGYYNDEVTEDDALYDDVVDNGGEFSGYEFVEFVGTTVYLEDELREREIYGSDLEPRHVNSLLFSQDGRRFLVGEGSAVTLWSIEIAHPIHVFWHNGDVLCVAFSPDGRLAISGSSDHTLRLWGLPEK